VCPFSPNTTIDPVRANGKCYPPLRTLNVWPGSINIFYPDLYSDFLRRLWLPRMISEQDFHLFDSLAALVVGQPRFWFWQKKNPRLELLQLTGSKTWLRIADQGTPCKSGLPPLHVPPRQERPPPFSLTGPSRGPLEAWTGPLHSNHQHFFKKALGSG
jgi:hypothetical protein